MKSRPTLLIGAFAPVLMAAWQARASTFSIATPGSASWEVFETEGGTRTVFNVRGDTVIHWDDFHLGSGSELVFDFSGGSSVTNQLNGGGVKMIDGSVLSNGVVGFFAPEADLVLNGSITAKGVVLSTLEGDAGVLVGGGILQSGAGGAGGQLRVNGSVTATGGDVLLAGSRVSLTTRSDVEASGAVMVAGSQRVSVAASGARRLGQSGEAGVVLHVGRVAGSRVEMVAGEGIRNGGVIDAGQGKVFLTVGDSGEIKQGLTAVIVGEALLDGMIRSADDVVMSAGGIDGDSAAGVSDGSLRIPALKRPDGSTVSGGRTVTYTSTMSASSDVAKARAGGDVTSRPVKQERASLMQRGSLFGLRGGVTRGVVQSPNTTSRR